MLHASGPGVILPGAGVLLAVGLAWSYMHTLRCHLRRRPRPAGSSVADQPDRPDHGGGAGRRLSGR